MRTPRPPTWLKIGLSTGLVVSAQVPIAVVLVWARPELLLGYPLVLLPLLLAGALAVRSVHGVTALAAALGAGIVSATVAVASLAFGSQVLGCPVWALVAPTSMAPVPELPHLELVPTWMLTWGQQDLLAAQPAFAVLVAAGILGLRKVAWPRRALTRLIPDSVGGRLRLTFVALIGLTLLVGWVGFTSLEDMHFRGHKLQLIARWQTTLDDVSAALDTEDVDPTAADRFAEIFDALEGTDTYPGVAVGPASIHALYARYDAEVDDVKDAHAAYRQNPSDLQAQTEVRSALRSLRDRIDRDTLALLDTDDIAHHERLFAVMIAVAIAGALGLWVGGRATVTVTQPIRELGAHLLQVAEGQFEGRVRTHGPAEMRELSAAVNHMTAELERLSHLERQTFQEQLWQQAFHDPLTGLPNRALLRDRLEQALSRAERQQHGVAVLFVDIDNFKLVNDSLGHEQGDALLLAVAQRIQSCLRAGDTAARIGGDEFTLLLEDVSGLEDAIAAAERVLVAVRSPLKLQAQEVFPTASIGITVCAAGQARSGAILREADLALYQAKAEGKDRYAVFKQVLHHHAAERLTLEADLRRALERDELRVYYQPIVSLHDGRAVEYEALVRWAHPERGLVAPLEFIPIAEQNGLIVPIGQRVLELACRQARDWHDNSPDSAPVLISVNLSARQFQHPGLLDDIRRAVASAGIDPHCLKLEITESTVMQDAEAAVATLHALKSLGIQVAIDDFGTGYSSLGYLRQFPIDTLKIDRSFVSGLGQDTQDTAIVRSIVALARSLGLSVTAEGVETVAQRLQLEHLGCEKGQGFLFARPLPAEELDGFLERNAPTRLAA